ncbi:hypothetical protein AGMMS50212_06730 [Spirochaetia bacterium]|nr:hypothetical protein AGMMS50212_06730 [Spirochaetia bacterium]
MARVMKQPQMGLTFEKVWAALMESRERMELAHERMELEHEETEKELKETGKYLKEMGERVDRMCERVDRVTANVGGINRSLGELIETLIAARLWEKFDAYPYNLKRAYQRVPLFDENNRIRSDIDILLANGEYAMAVEVKASLHREDDVDYHLKRMELILKYPPAECKGKILLGAMAGGIVKAEIRDRAHSAGFFVLELTGESVSLAEPPAGFIPRQW